MVILYRTGRRRKGFRSHLSTMITRSSWALREFSEVMSVLSKIYTLATFATACSLVPLLFTFYTVSSFVRETWINFLQKRFPDLEFVRKISVRAAVETRRNIGVLAVLVTVRGQCDPMAIKRRLLDDILDKRRNDGQFVYRHLRMSLTTRWGRYAWQELEPFDVDNHLLISSSFYRGRSVTENSIQEYVSDIVSKYLPPELPPWQIVVIPTSSGPQERYYMLIRIHHMLLSDDGPDLGDLLLINRDQQDATSLDSPRSGNSSLTRRSHPFHDLYKQPVALPALYQQLTETFSNYWNEFLSSYDPVENPTILKNPTVTKLTAIVIITIISILRKLLKKNKRYRKTIKSEIKRRQLSLSLFLNSITNTLNPIVVVARGIKFIAAAAILFFIKWPILVISELRYICLTYNDRHEIESYSKSMFEYWKLAKDSLKEFWYFTKMVYNGPRVILEELLFVYPTKHQLQTVSLCGRKVVSWSDRIPISLINNIEDATGASSSEILISATTESLAEYFRHYGLDVPNRVLTTARYFPQEQLLHMSRRVTASSNGRGLLCLALPTRSPFGEDDDPLACLRAVQQVVLQARLRQPALYLASLLQLDHGLLTQVLPSAIVRLILNMLSRRYAVTLSEISPNTSVKHQRRFLWDHEVEDVMYWTPPQANISVSLTLMTFGDTVRLGVMADSLLSPQHTIITSTFAQHLRELASAAGVSRSHSIPSDISESVTTELPQSTSSSLDFDMDSRSDDDNTNIDDFCKNNLGNVDKLKFNY